MLTGRAEILVRGPESQEDACGAGKDPSLCSWFLGRMPTGHIRRIGTAPRPPLSCLARGHLLNSSKKNFMISCARRGELADHGRYISTTLISRRWHGTLTKLIEECKGKMVAMRKKES